MFSKRKDGWFKPYILNYHNIEKFVWEGKPGVYILGNMNEGKKIKVEHIRMSQNAKDELKNYLGKFHVFMYKPLTTRNNELYKNQQTLQFI